MDNHSQAFLKEYIELEKYPREHRTRNQLLTQLFARYPGLEQTSFEDLLLLLDQLKDSQVSLCMPLFTALVYPVLKREIETENPQAMLLLIHHFDLLLKYAIRQKKQPDYSERALIKRYLVAVPDDRHMLRQQLRFLALDLEYALHELPAGVLFGPDAATPDECLELLGMLDEYVDICQKLQIDFSEDKRRDSAMHFQGYRDYLLHSSLYNSYLDYIQHHHLPVNHFR
jgi:hypothetical protein